jgi:hypothetical protein
MRKSHVPGIFCLAAGGKPVAPAKIAGKNLHFSAQDFLETAA